VELYSGGKDHAVLKWRGSVDKLNVTVGEEDDQEYWD
jgi:hypothetical protein